MASDWPSGHNLVFFPPKPWTVDEAGHGVSCLTLPPGGGRWTSVSRVTERGGAVRCVWRGPSLLTWLRSLWFAPWACFLVDGGPALVGLAVVPIATWALQGLPAGHAWTGGRKAEGLAGCYSISS